MVLAARTPLYREVADAVVETDGRSVEQVAGLVIDAWSRYQGRARVRRGLDG